MSQNSPIIIRFSDPGLHPREFRTYDGLSFDKALEEGRISGYTRACVTIEGKDHWLQCFLGGSNWLPFSMHQALRPYFSPEDV